MIIIGLGANIPSEFGPPEKTLQAAVNAIGDIEGIEILEVSSIWHSAPIPVSDQPWYANAVCVIETQIPPSNLLKELKAIEKNFGRLEKERNAPRVLDLDLLAYDRLIIMDAPILPHPRMHERAFVLYPLHEIAPDWIHPALETSLEEMLASLPPEQEIRKGEKLSVPLKVVK
ncbi:MAG: 2-amino-4-hydroxy-6-hydroxymethyldihydropteridine diphosphokinase [Alphaproteobacteria bacterium]|nr:2-amino-4-hydroxy-6-hydroxymethyldihydropteridine diphosphokinase [Alphaproteobacteria bacterium]QQS56191.1 MAG: 2-amino-4-hydroxy-6-hydroxymethyldihydropteridine diphosphokinase [Alphaproteobacteria bacterium]